MSIFDSSVQLVSGIRAQIEARDPALFGTVSDSVLSTPEEVAALRAGRHLVQWRVITTNRKGANAPAWSELSSPAFGFTYGTPVDATYAPNFVWQTLNGTGWGQPGSDAFRAFLDQYPNATPAEVTAAAQKANALNIAPSNAFNTIGQNVAMLAAAAGFAYVAYAGISAATAPVSTMPTATTTPTTLTGAVTSSNPVTASSVSATSGAVSTAPATGFSALGSAPIDLSASGIGAGSGMTAASVPTSIGAATNAAIGTNMVAGATATDTLAATLGTSTLPGAVYAGSTIPGVTMSANGTIFDSLGNIISPDMLPSGSTLASSAKAAALGFLAPSPAPKAPPAVAAQPKPGMSLPTLAALAAAAFVLVKFAL